jgi:hypothetical protein
VLILFCLPETLRCLVGNGSVYANSSWFVKPRLRQKQLVADGLYPKPPKPTVAGFLRVLTFVPNAILCFTSAFNFSGLSAMYVVFPRVWQKTYGWSGSETGYAYLAPGMYTLFHGIQPANGFRCGFDGCIVHSWARWRRHLPTIQGETQWRESPSGETTRFTNVRFCHYSIGQGIVRMVCPKKVPSCRWVGRFSTR